MGEHFLNGRDLTEEAIMRLLDEHLDPGASSAHQHALRQAAVLVPLLRLDGEWHLLYTRRTDTVLTHKGQVAFPGGAVDVEDATVVDAALRETYEEIGLLPGQVTILGQMPDYVSISNFLITPIVGRIDWPFELVLSPGEVMRAFTIPLRWLADPTNWEERLFTRPDGSQEMVVFYQTYSDELLWGITARITLNFLRILQLR